MPFVGLSCTSAPLMSSTSVWACPEKLGNLVKTQCVGDRLLQLSIFSKECLVRVSHQLVLIKALPCVHIARRLYRLSAPVHISDRSICCFLGRKRTLHKLPGELQVFCAFRVFLKACLLQCLLLSAKNSARLVSSGSFSALRFRLGRPLIPWMCGCFDLNAWSAFWPAGGDRGAGRKWERPFGRLQQRFSLRAQSRGG